jgi:hypothetical protein
MTSFARMITLVQFCVAIACTIVASEAKEWAGIQVVDSTNERGIPLVELETTNALRFVTDNNGMIAIDDPDLLDQETFFHVFGHGYEIKKDNFGISGFRCTLKRGTIIKVRLDRKCLAERMVRLTGSGLWHDSDLLQRRVPLANQPVNGKVVGQDSIQAVTYNGKVFCLWGDTSRSDYPLGLFRTCGATYALTTTEGQVFDPSYGIPYDYFTDSTTGFVRAMMPLSERPEGVIWMSGLAVVTDDETSKEVLVAHYSRRQGLFKELEQGIAIYNERQRIFEPVTQITNEKEWRRPHGHALRIRDDSGDWILFGNPFANVRVPAMLKAICDPSLYEAYAPVSSRTEKEVEAIRWTWQKTESPMDAQREVASLQGEEKKKSEPHFSPVDCHNRNKRILLHSGTVRWNEFRQKWIIIAGRIYGEESVLGEVWYAEADQPTGPFKEAVRIASHDKQSFYNVCHHDFLDRNDGKIIFFEGTYTNEFSGNPYKTPRDHYNQILYRLDLSDPRFQAALNP